MDTTLSQPRTGKSPLPPSSRQVDEISNIDCYINLHLCTADPNKPPSMMKEASEEGDGETKKEKGKRSRKAENEEEEEDGKEGIKNKGKKGKKSRQTEKGGDEVKEEDSMEEKENTGKRLKNGVIEDSDDE